MKQGLLISSTKTESYKKVGYVVQRAILIYTVLCIPVCLLWYFSGSFFVLVVGTPEVARLAGIFVK